MIALTPFFTVTTTEFRQYNLDISTRSHLGTTVRYTLLAHCRLHYVSHTLLTHLESDRRKRLVNTAQQVDSTENIADDETNVMNS